MMNGFRFIAENVREYQGRTLTSDDPSNDLDYIFERDGHAYGCEIKNRFGYISRSLLRSKMQICRQLGVTPLFILRMAAKNYIEAVRNPGPGFTLIFQTHIYTLGHRQLVDDIKREFQGLPVDCPRDLPGSIMNRFLRWHRTRPPAAQCNLYSYTHPNTILPLPKHTLFRLLVRAPVSSRKTFARIPKQFARPPTPPGSAAAHAPQSVTLDLSGNRKKMLVWSEPERI
jgi:hypothetical protein